MGRLMKHSSVYALGGMLNRIGVFLLLPVYTSFLTLAEYGTLELFYATASVAAGVLSAGLAHATLRFYFEYDSPDDRNAVVSTNLVLGTSLGIAGAIAIALYRVPLSELVFGSPAAATGLMIMATTMALEMSTQICLGFVRAREASSLFLGIVLARLVIQVGVNTYAVIGLGAGVTGVLAGNCIAVGVGWLIAAYYTVSRCGLRVDPGKAGPILRYSLPFVASTIVGIVAANIDRVFIRKLLSFEALGLFALALKFSMLPEQLVGEPFNRAYGSFRFSIMHQENAAPIQARVVRLLLAVALFVALGIQFFAVDALRWLSDVSFQGATVYLPPLLLAGVLRVVTYPLQTGILVQRKTNELFRINLAKSILYIGGSLVLIRTMGIAGVCLALTLTAAFTMVATDRAAQRHFPVRYEWDRIARIVLITAGAFFAGLPLVAMDSFGALVGKAAVLAAFSAALIGSAAFDDTERAMARDWIAARVAGLTGGGMPAGQEGV
jgi:O-antigen/teichoic acid export membrane protein